MNIPTEPHVYCGGCGTLLTPMPPIMQTIVSATGETEHVRYVDFLRLQLAEAGERELRFIEELARLQSQGPLAFYEGRKFQSEHPEVPLG